MFLIHVIGIFAGILFFSIVVGEALLPYEIKNRIGKVAVLTSGFVLISFSNSALLNVFSIQTSCVITACYFFLIWWCFRRRGIDFDNWRALLREYSGGILGLLLLLNVFFAPLHIAGVYGPFSDGGGDISIYSDLAKSFSKNGEPAYGLKSILENISSAFDFDRTISSRLEAEYINPPLAEAASNWIISVQEYSASYFASIAQWSFISNDIYAIFFALLGFFFACAVSIFIMYFRKFGKIPAYFAGALLVSSLSFISIFYNMYFLQSLAVLISMCIIYFIDRLSPQRLSSHIFIMLFIFFLISTYVVAIFVPIGFYILFVMTEFSGRSFITFIVRNSREVYSKATYYGKVMLGLTIFAFCFWFFADIFVATVGRLVKGFIKMTRSSDNGLLLTYMGESYSFFGRRWGAFVSGASSQQYFEPFVLENRGILNSILVATALFYYVIATNTFGGLIVFKNRLKVSFKKEALVVSLHFALTILVLALYSFLGAKSLYTQAKAFQYVLPIVYAFLVLSPLSVLYLNRSLVSSKIRLGMNLGFFALFLMIGSLLVPRIYFLYELAHGKGRGRILEQSYFDQAEKIIRLGLGGKSIVLVEPVKSADVYMNIHPFFGHNMMVTKDLAYYKKIDYSKNDQSKSGGAQSSFQALDYVALQNRPEDVWLLSPKVVLSGKSKISGEFKSYSWESLLMRDISSPILVVSADYYEKFYKKKSIFFADQPVWTTFVRNGGFGIFFPPHAIKRVISIQISSEKDSELFEILQSVKKMGAEKVKISRENQSLLITWVVAPQRNMEFIYFAKAMVPFEFGIRIDGIEMGPLSHM